MRAQAMLRSKASRTACAGLRSPHEEPGVSDVVAGHGGFAEWRHLRASRAASGSGWARQGGYRHPGVDPVFRQRVIRVPVGPWSRTGAAGDARVHGLDLASAPGRVPVVCLRSGCRRRPGLPGRAAASLAGRAEAAAARAHLVATCWLRTARRRSTRTWGPMSARPSESSAVPRVVETTGRLGAGSGAGGEAGSAIGPSAYRPATVGERSALGR
jgi:hypothetical protein